MSWAKGQFIPMNLRLLCPLLSSGPSSMRIALYPLCLPPFGCRFWLIKVSCHEIFERLLYASIYRDLPSAKLSPSRWGVPGGSDDKESTCGAGDLGSIPGLGRSPGEGSGYPLQCSGLENSMGCIVHGVTESDTTERVVLTTD
ncbi:unnamed protein product [Rangifer tarandus platyrhynchus]|uniref:Uncharacterized protein n=1 Tax=Rangifer tarandus platyrhynchus TaxID=3082113 RepID=A0ABN8YTF5_RANTA|nr:unnamed protein product [Rangifer tarandus platyrhynchus]